MTWGLAPRLLYQRIQIVQPGRTGEGELKMKDVKGTIIKIIAEYLDKEETEISSTATFSEIGLDSLDIMELVMQMQEELDCKIELSQEITTIDKLVELIEKQ